MLFCFSKQFELLTYVCVRRNDVLAIPNAKTSESGQQVLSERSELRNLRQSTGQYSYSKNTLDNL